MWHKIALPPESYNMSTRMKYSDETQRSGTTQGTTQKNDTMKRYNGRGQEVTALEI